MYLDFACIVGLFGFPTKSVLLIKFFALGFLQVIHRDSGVFVARSPLMQDCIFQATLRPDIRIRIRSRIIRIRINEPRIRTIIRITAEQNATTKDNPLIFF